MRSLILLVVALVCFAVSFLLAVQWIFHGGNYPAWIAAGLFFFAGSFVPPLIPGGKP